VRDRPFARWWPIALGVVAALVGGVLSIGLVATNALDSPTTAGWVLAWAALLGGMVVGAILVGVGVRRLALRGLRQAAGVGVLVAVPSALAPWVLAAVAA
jgi:hypothetical protein